MSFRPYFTAKDIEPQPTLSQVVRRIRSWGEQGRRDTRIVSHSLYSFDLVTNALVIQDNDFFLLATDEAGFKNFFERYRYLDIKNIRRDNKSLTTGVFVLNEIPSTADQLTQGNECESLVLKTSATKVGDHPLTTIRLYDTDTADDLRGKILRTAVVYQVDLKLKHQKVVSFMGAIQPSDYKDAGLLFKNVGEVEKCIEVAISSDTGFFAVVQNGDDRSFSPSVEEARASKDGRHVVHKSMFKNIASLQGRASYFSVFASPKNCLDGLCL